MCCRASSLRRNTPTTASAGWWDRAVRKRSRNSGSSSTTTTVCAAPGVVCMVPLLWALLYPSNRVSLWLTSVGTESTRLMGATLSRAKGELARVVCCIVPMGHEDGGELGTHPPIIANARVHHKEGKPSDSAPRRMGGFPSCATSVAALSFVDTYNLFFEPIVVRTMTIVIDSKAPNSWPNAQAVYGECTVELEKWEQTLHGCLWKATKGVAPCAVQVARTVLNGPNRARPHVQGVWLNCAIFPRLACRTDKSVLFNTAMLPLS